MPTLSQLYLPFHHELLRTRVQCHPSQRGNEAPLRAQVSALLSTTQSMPLFSLWASYLLTSAAERILKGAVFDKLGGVITSRLEADKPDTSEASKALLHYAYLVVSELAAAVLQPASVVNTFQAINLPKAFSFQEALQEVRCRKSPYDGLSARLAHSITHRIATELIWSALATRLSPEKLLLPLPALSAEIQNEEQRRDELRTRAGLRWRKTMWFSLLHGLASSASSLLTLPLAFTRNRVESQGLSFRSTDIAFSGFFDALSHLFSSSGQPILTGPSLLTCVQSILLSVSIDLGANLALYVAGILAIDRIEAWCPISCLEALQ